MTSLPEEVLRTFTEEQDFVIKPTTTVISISNLSTFLPIQPSVLDNSYTVQNAREVAVHPSVTSITKRLFDILGAVVGLGVTAVVTIPVALAIALDNPGPIFYSQTRARFERTHLQNLEIPLDGGRS